MFFWKLFCSSERNDLWALPRRKMKSMVEREFTSKWPSSILTLEHSVRKSFSDLVALTIKYNIAQRRNRFKRTGIRLWWNFGGCELFEEETGDLINLLCLDKVILNHKNSIGPDNSQAQMIFITIKVFFWRSKTLCTTTKCGYSW